MTASNWTYHKIFSSINQQPTLIFIPSSDAIITWFFYFLLLLHLHSLLTRFKYPVPIYFLSLSFYFQIKILSTP